VLWLLRFIRGDDIDSSISLFKLAYAAITVTHVSCWAVSGTYYLLPRRVKVLMFKKVKKDPSILHKAPLKAPPKTL
jgi:hypothetical protein|tara:strand:- start:8266 stop:8493 length:228 start_codon:yes stop_codon:yes gene_type:complete